jgi:hypothetical protein
MRAGLTDLGMAERPAWKCQRNMTLSRGLPVRAGDLAQRSIFERILPAGPHRNEYWRSNPAPVELVRMDVFLVSIRSPRYHT